MSVSISTSLLAASMDSLWFWYVIAVVVAIIGYLAIFFAIDDMLNDLSDAIRKCFRGDGND